MEEGRPEAVHVAGTAEYTDVDGVKPCGRVLAKDEVGAAGDE